MLCYIILVTFQLRLCFFVLLFALMHFPPVLIRNLPLALRFVCPQCNYLHLHCAVSVTDLEAAESAHK
jgi:hypothetical protein